MAARSSGATWEADMTRPVEITEHEQVIAGARIAWREAGDPDAPVLLLVHGLIEDSRTWNAVIPALAEHHRVIAPDLLGHGGSARPRRGDYSPPALATHVRDLLLVLGVDRATIVGHSLGGGIALQLTYLWPELAERLVLVCAGGLGRSVTPLLKAMSIPVVAPAALELLATRYAVELARATAEAGEIDDPKIVDWLAAAGSFARRRNRLAILRLIRGVIGLDGQQVGVGERIRIASRVPTLIVWGKKDPIIPVGHGHRARDQIAGSRLIVFNRAGHFPHLDHPDAFAELVVDFVADSLPARLTASDLAEELAAMDQDLDYDPRRTPRARSAS